MVTQREGEKGCQQEEKIIKLSLFYWILANPAEDYQGRSKTV
jgi:hypothetical protein